MRNDNIMDTWFWRMCVVLFFVVMVLAAFMGKE